MAASGAAAAAGVQLLPRGPRSQRGRHPRAATSSGLQPRTWFQKHQGQGAARVLSPHGTKEQINTRTNQPHELAPQLSATPHPRPEDREREDADGGTPRDPAAQLAETADAEARLAGDEARGFLHRKEVSLMAGVR